MVRVSCSQQVPREMETVLVSSPSHLKIKRKFKTSPKDKKRVTRWWFVVRGDETTLDKLDKSWQQLKLQTNWKLEPVLRYIDDAGSEGSADTIATTDTTPLTTVNANAITNTTATTSTNAANDINDILVTNTDKPGEAEDGHPTLNEDGNPSQAHTLSSQPNPVTTSPQVRTTSHFLSTS